eukprot:gnl/TRDRNA2_/TRDRNA2_80950_c0_seq1.p1 gnl/TRDRNA2_/TRDRNA2_80950_c0~~gnl/TRDRNA2_/TRDRNA2_80950_c0_seq1.p1  ORF type:complete len:447 (+),score=43.20 gnl/TRDRNA2_/TRDRNA2_80950_c0_seq1:83-1423(+)
MVLDGRGLHHQIFLSHMVRVFALLLLHPFTLSVRAESARAWRLVNAGEAPSSRAWSVYELDMFGDFYVDEGTGATHCSDEFNASIAQVLASGTSRNQPENAFQDLVKLGGGWNSQRHTGPFEAWIGLEFPMDVEVKCVRLYQSGLASRKGNMGFAARRVALQHQSASGEWITSARWGATGDSEQALHGWTWLTLPVGRPFTPAFTECPNRTHMSKYYTCCVWPYFGRPLVDAGFLFDSGNSECDALATVSSGTHCKLTAPRCNGHGEIVCQKGHARLSMIPLSANEGSMNFAQESHCIALELQRVKHGGTPLVWFDLVVADFAGLPLPGIGRPLAADNKTIVEKGIESWKHAKAIGLGKMPWHPAPAPRPGSDSHRGLWGLRLVMLGGGGVLFLMCYCCPSRWCKSLEWHWSRQQAACAVEMPTPISIGAATTGLPASAQYAPLQI